MSNPGLASRGPRCSLTHNLINKLSVIVGECELLNEHAMEAECARRLGVIIKTAQTMAAELQRHHCHCEEIEMGEARKQRRECQPEKTAPSRWTNIS